MTDKRYSEHAEIHVRTLDSTTYQMLRERPRPADEISSIGTGSKAGIRHLIRRIGGIGGSSSAKPYGSKNSTQIIYLYGDERRAIRVFIEHNTEYVESCLNSPPSPLHLNWGVGCWACSRRSLTPISDSRETND